MILRTLLYIMGFFLVVGWAIGYFIWKPGPLIHIMAFMGVVALLLGVTRKEGIR